MNHKIDYNDRKNKICETCYHFGYDLDAMPAEGFCFKKLGDRQKKFTINYCDDWKMDDLNQGFDWEEIETK